jgi:hypothetical protein
LIKSQVRSPGADVGAFDADFADDVACDAAGSVGREEHPTALRSSRAAAALKVRTLM